jgi:hypothetical protein
MADDEEAKASVPTTWYGKLWAWIMCVASTPFLPSFSLLLPVSLANPSSVQQVNRLAFLPSPHDSTRASVLLFSLLSVSAVPPPLFPLTTVFLSYSGIQSHFLSSTLFSSLPFCARETRVAGRIAVRRDRLVVSCSLFFKLLRCSVSSSSAYLDGVVRTVGRANNGQSRRKRESSSGDAPSRTKKREN